MNLRIAVTMRYEPADGGAERACLDRRYRDYLTGVGAVPLPIVATVDAAVLAAALDSVSGLLLTGGRDLDPALWGQPPHPAARLLHPRRQESELLLFRLAHRRRLPILGICLGIQLINVALGGSLHQHLPDLLPGPVHQVPSGALCHRILLEKDSGLYRWLQRDQVTVNSYHHQGIDRLGTDLRVAARDENGMIEAVEQPGYPFLLGLQWHPERDPDDPVNRTIMTRFLAAARQHQA